MKDIEIKDNGGTKLVLPITMAVGIALFIIMAVWTVQSTFVLKADYREDIMDIKTNVTNITNMVTDIRSDMGKVKMALGYKGVYIDKMKELN